MWFYFLRNMCCHSFNNECEANPGVRKTKERSFQGGEAPCCHPYRMVETTFLLQRDLGKQQQSDVNLPA